MACINMTTIKKIILSILRSRFKLIGVLLVVLLIGYFGYRTVLLKPSAARYQTQPVQKGDIVFSITVSGQVVNANFIKVTTSASGVVSKVYVKDGDSVLSGQKIAELSLDSQGLQKSAKVWSAYIAAKSSLDSAQAKLNSLQSAAFKTNQKLINDAVARSLKTDDPTYIQENADWLQAEADYKNQSMAISSAQASLSSAWLDYSAASPIIYTPQAGKVGNVTILAGINIGGDTVQTVATIYSEGVPVVTFNLSEVDVSKVKIGQKASVTLDGVPGKTFTGQVQSVNRVGVVSSGVTNYPVLIKLDTDSVEILPNMAATANILLDNKDNVLVIPSSAITTQNGQSIVRVFKNGQVQEVPVEAGLSSDIQTEIKSGLSEGDEVVTGTISGGTSRTGTSPFNTFNQRGFGGGGLNPGGRGGR